MKMDYEFIYKVAMVFLCKIMPKKREPKVQKIKELAPGMVYVEISFMAGIIGFNSSIAQYIFYNRRKWRYRKLLFSDKPLGEHCERDEMAELKGTNIGLIRYKDESREDICRDVKRFLLRQGKHLDWYRRPKKVWMPKEQKEN